MSTNNLQIEAIEAKMKELDENINYWHNKEQELQGMLDMTFQMSDGTKTQLSRGASSSTVRKGFGETVSIRDQEESLYEICANVREKLQQLYLELHDLGAEKARLAREMQSQKDQEKRKQSWAWK